LADGTLSLIKATESWLQHNSNFTESSAGTAVTNYSLVYLAVAICSLIATVAAALEPKEQRGFTFARANCAMCHAVGKIGDSPLPEAPPFRMLHDRYPVEDLQESLAEGIMTGHPTMPQWQLDPGQISDLISYLRTLER
jgi:cytochrome c